MNCEKSAVLLALRSGGDLPAKDARALATHVETCEACHKLGDELAESLAWMRTSAAPPASEADYAGIRREVWQRIEAGKPKSHGQFGRRLVLTAAGLFAAALAAVLLVRRAPEDPSTVASAPPPATLGAAAAVQSPAPASVETPAVFAPSPPATEPSRVAASLPRDRVRPRPPGSSGESRVERIEFRTANPNVRIIWLVKKGEEKSSSLGAGPLEEAS
jgi:hypothetical protein